MSTERRAAVARLREQGLSLRSIAEQLGVTKSTVERDIAEVSREPRDTDPETVAVGGEQPATVPTLGGGSAPICAGQVDGSGLSAAELDDLLMRGYQVMSTTTARDLGQITQDDVLISEAEFFLKYGCRRPPPRLDLAGQLMALPLGVRPRIRHVQFRQGDV